MANGFSVKELHQNVMFSIIVPVYNAEKYLDECLKSIMAQKYENFEAVLVDDGSDDGSGKICDEYSQLDKRFKVIHKKNNGVVEARRSGVNIARGEYICCVDADDWLSDSYLESFAEHINKRHCDMVCCGYYWIRGENTTTELIHLNEGLYDKERIIQEIYPILIQAKNGYSFLPTLWGKAIKRDTFIDSYAYLRKSLVIGEDGACIIPCVYNSSSIYIDRKPLYYYRYNFESATRSRKVYSWQIQKDIYKILAAQIDLTKYDFADQMYRRMTKGFYITAKSKFYQKKRYHEIKTEILREIHEFPFSVSIKKCHYKGTIKHSIMAIILKSRMVFVIKILSRYM